MRKTVLTNRQRTIFSDIVRFFTTIHTLNTVYKMRNTFLKSTPEFHMITRYPFLKLKKTQQEHPRCVFHMIFVS